MTRFSDQILDNYDRPVSGAKVYVYLWDEVLEVAGALDTLTNDLAAPLTNPVSTDADGIFYFNAANGVKLLDIYYNGVRRWREVVRLGPLPVGPVGPAGDVAKVADRTALAAITGQAAGATRYLTEAGREGSFVFRATNLSAAVTADPQQGIYVAPASDPTGASGAWVRTGWAILSAEWLGLIQGAAAGANATANNSVWTGLKTLLTYLAANAGSVSQGIPPAEFGKGFFEFSTAHDYNFGTVTVRGKGGAYAGNGAATILKFYNCTGIRVQSSDTSGASTKDGVPHQSGQLSSFEDMTVIGTFDSGSEAEYHGLHARAPVRFKNFYCHNFAGDGFRLEGDSAGALGGNASVSNGLNGGASLCRNGFYANGNDANAGTFINLNCAENRQWGIWDSSFLGNTFVGGHTATNGYVSGGSPPSQVFHTGNVYFVVTGQEVGASTNAPSGTTADNTWWAWRSAAGGADATFYPTWVSGTTYRAGGAARADDVNAAAVFYGVYAEGDQGKAQVAQRCLIIGGQLARWRWTGPAAINSGPTLASDAGNIQVPGGMDVGGAFTTSGDMRVNGASGTARYYRWQTAGVNSNSYIALGGDNNTVFYSVSGAYSHNFQVGGGNIALITAAGIDLVAAKTLAVNSVQVVTGRKTGWAVDTGTAKRTANATYAAGTTLAFGAGYVQAEHTAVGTRLAAVEAALQDATQTIKALKDDLHGTAGHGLIGT